MALSAMALRTLAAGEATVVASVANSLNINWFHTAGLSQNLHLGGTAVSTLQPADAVDMSDSRSQ